ncbi:MAG: hypothetical protein ACRD5B_09290 [Nitrososphaeraceae archaeon]
MAILAIFKANGITKEMYEALRKEVDWEHQHPDGAVLHAGAFDDSGNFCVADIWESQEHLNNYINNRLLPVIKKIICQCLRERFFKSMMLVLFQALVNIESGIKHNSQG